MVQTPRSTSNSSHHIKLHASHQTPRKHQTPHNTLQARYNATPSNGTHNQRDRVDTTTSARGMEAQHVRGAVSRQKTPSLKSTKKVLRAKGFGESLVARPPGTAVGKPTCHVDERGGVSAPPDWRREAEARPEGAWSRKRGGPMGRGPGLQKGVRTS